MCSMCEKYLVLMKGVLIFTVLKLSCCMVQLNENKITLLLVII